MIPLSHSEKISKKIKILASVNSVEGYVTKFLSWYQVNSGELINCFPTLNHQKIVSFSAVSEFISRKVAAVFIKDFLPSFLLREVSFLAKEWLFLWIGTSNLVFPFLSLGLIDNTFLYNAIRMVKTYVRERTCGSEVFTWYITFLFV